MKLWIVVWLAFGECVKPPGFPPENVVFECGPSKTEVAFYRDQKAAIKKSDETKGRLFKILYENCDQPNTIEGNRFTALLDCLEHNKGLLVNELGIIPAQSYEIIESSVEVKNR